MLDQSIIDNMNMGTFDEDMLLDESAYIDIMLDEEAEMDEVHLTESSVDFILDSIADID